ncbi:MAG: hypothetical protein M3R27_02200 [Bacteroidota bacterium]|nr:hypothetical protein [Bacteroidota bacterium]
MLLNNQNRYSNVSIILIFVVILSVFFYFGLWKKNRVTLDSPSYYTYLPAALIHQDLQLKYIDKNPEYYKNKVWFYRIEGNKKLIKHPAGWSVMMSPFFIAGHIIAKSTGAVAEGYSMTYQNAISIGVLICLLIGLLYLRKILLDYFSDKVTAITLLAIVLGTNLLWYSTFEGFMPHTVSFSLLCICIYNFLNWLKEGRSKFLVGFALALGCSILIRPLAITVIVYFLIHGFLAKGGMKAFLDFLKPQWKLIIAAAGITFLIAFVQLAYWKMATGNWLFDVYVDEHFVFSSPQMFAFLFSFRKGLFVYSPVLIFSIIGFVYLFKKHKDFFWSSVILLTLTVFLLSSWWAWSYGISWGLRPMIDYYSFLAIPLAAGFTVAFNSGRFFRILGAIALFLFLALNLFQTWQYKNELIHYDDMSRESYFIGFMQTKESPGWRDHLKPYNWQRRIAGLSQIEYSNEFIKNYPSSKSVYFRGSNLLYVSSSIQADFVLTCYFNEIGKEEQFYIERSGDMISIKASNGKYLSHKPHEHDIVVADATFAGETEKFKMTIIDDNKITLQALNGKMLSIGEKPPFIIRATEASGSSSYFRIFSIDDHQTR